MATLISPTDQRVIIKGVSWETYARLLFDFQDSHAARVAFDRGTLEIMTPSFAHERPAHLLTQMVERLAEVRGIDLIGAGSTTFKRDDMERGFEPDASFYIQHASEIRDNADIDLAHDPAPDLVIEIDLTHLSLDKFPIYSASGVPEVWRYAEHTVTIYRLAEDGYLVEEKSEVLPGVTSSRLTEFVALGHELPRPEWLKQMQDWVDHLPV